MCFWCKLKVKDKTISVNKITSHKKTKTKTNTKQKTKHPQKNHPENSVGVLTFVCFEGKILEV